MWIKKQIQNMNGSCAVSDGNQSMGCGASEEKKGDIIAAVTIKHTNISRDSRLSDCCSACKHPPAHGSGEDFITNMILSLWRFIQKVKNMYKCYLLPGCFSYMPTRYSFVGRKHFMMKGIEIQREILNLNNVSLLDTCRILKKAWGIIILQTIRNSFIHQGLISDQFEEDVLLLPKWLSIYKLSTSLSGVLECIEDIQMISQLTEKDNVIQITSLDITDELVDKHVIML